MIHDIGGQPEGAVDFQERRLSLFEQQVHSLLVLLSQKKKNEGEGAILTTDELRKGVEDLEETSYRLWDYYDRWSVAMTTILLRKQVFSEVELHEELWGDSDRNQDASKLPLFQVGDEVQVHSEDSRLRWRKPHLRCPGYIFNCKGHVEKYIGQFDDPFFAAFGGKGPMQHLYTVSFHSRDVWPEGYDSLKETAPELDDKITIEIYEGWLKRPTKDIADCDNVVFSSNRGVNKIGSGDSSVVPGGHSHRHEHNHESSSFGTEFSAEDSQVQEHAHDHNHDHVHESRVTVECRAVGNEQPETPGKRIGEALMRLLLKKQIITSQELRDTVAKLESFGQRLLGADLVVKAWLDENFKNRLLSDAPAAAMEIDVVTSNSNAPTVLRVVECTPTVHHICVCTLCSCYPSGLLGLSPAWYRSRSYRSRTIREPRKVLEEFGTFIDPSVAVHVHDSTADCRYMVLPLRPSGTEGWSAEQLRSIVTRDSMIGISQLTAH